METKAGMKEKMTAMRPLGIEPFCGNMRTKASPTVRNIISNPVLEIPGREEEEDRLDAFILFGLLIFQRKINKKLRI